MRLCEPAALAERSRALEGRPPRDVLAWALAEYAPKVAISTAFGVEGCAVIDMATKIDAGVQVFTADTEFLFPETRELLDRMVDRYRLNLTVLRGEVSRDEQERRHGLSLWAHDSDRCCALRKVEPTRRALVGLDAWITGLRRDQGRSRAGIQILERYDHDDGTPLVKVNPLAGWTRNDTWRYVMEQNVPYNPLLDRGYKSVGCWPCTQPVGADGDERAGRWAGTDKTECGIHTQRARTVAG